ncbi:MAG: hypothetical protein ABW292_15270 [Vicinamibacterales bacterium]
MFLRKYLQFRAQQLNDNQRHVLRIPLGQVKGLSRSFTGLAGDIAVNLESGAYRVSLNGLTPRATYSVWLVDRPESDDGTSPQPDATIKLATIAAARASAVQTGEIPPDLPTGFRIDRVVVVQGDAFASDALATGSVNVFQKIFFRRLSLRSESTSAVDFSETTTAPPRRELIPDLAAETEAARTASSAGSSGSSVPLDVLISQGARAFNEETFDGNGRTCATCHPSSNNFTIDPAFIATLPAQDPLFVAEFNPALAELERPQLMRQFGLILENLDGLSDPTHRFVMRGVPHTLGLQASLDKDSSMGTGAPTQMTGWSADGAPSTGSLRDFAIGAVIQHFTKSLARKEHQDFNLPSEHQLDTLEAFQLSLGRTADMELSKITFVNADLNTGKGLFINGGGDPAFTGTCNFCHTNGGALSAGLGNQNRNFNTNVEAVTHPARGVQTYPVDGGFGQLPANSDGSFGNRAFNTPSLLEAADTPPFFHNNVALTLEEAVGFYSGPEFNAVAVGKFKFDSTQNQQIANFLRGMNTLQNINVARRELLEVLLLSSNPQREVRTRLQTAADETQDATEVLTGAKLYPLAVKELAAAKTAIEQALKASDPTQRRSLVQQGAARLLSARNAVATIAQ